MKQVGETFSDATRRYVLGVLVVTYTFNFIDRQILGILVEPIKRDLGVSDTAMGLLTGLAFAVFYTFMGIPIARIADRTNRRNLIAAALAVWSLFTALQGFAQNFIQLLLFRIGVGVGEAGCSPPSHSMLADYYPARASRDSAGHLCPWHSLRRPLWLLRRGLDGGIFRLALGLRGGGRSRSSAGCFGALYVKEPPRGMSETIQPAADAPPAVQPPVKEVIAYVAGARSFIHMAVGGGVTAFVGYGLITFAAAFFTRSHGMGSGELGTYLGLIFGIPGGIGIALGGRLADHFGAGIRAGICGWCPLGC